MEDTVTITRAEYEALQRKGHGWQIMDASTGLFSTGGMRPRWTKGGKVYGQKNHLISHLRLLVAERDRFDPLYSFRDYNLFYSEDVSLAWEVWKQRKWYHPEEFLPSCWRVVDPDGNLMTIAEAFASSMTHYGSHGKVKGIPEEWRR